LALLDCAAIWYALTARGSAIPISIVSALVAMIILPGLLSPILILGLLIPQTRRLFSVVLVGFATFVLTLLLTSRSFYAPIYFGGLERAAGRADPLISAIRDYERQQGVPPASLGELVPKYLPALPDTGVAATPHFEYAIAKAETGMRTWYLAIDLTPLGFMNLDTFVYDPDGYFGTASKSVGRWSYFYF
jgi:hypothetical protein